MIHIEARLSDGQVQLHVEGHSHVEGGQVCAAISAIAHTAVLGLAEIARQHPDHVSIDLHEE